MMSGRVTSAMTRNLPPQFGQIDRSIANTLRSGTSHGAPSTSSAQSVQQGPFDELHPAPAPERAHACGVVCSAATGSAPPHCDAWRWGRGCRGISPGCPVVAAPTPRVGPGTRSARTQNGWCRPGMASSADTRLIAAQSACSSRCELPTCPAPFVLSRSNATAGRVMYLHNRSIRSRCCGAHATAAFNENPSLSTRPPPNLA